MAVVDIYIKYRKSIGIIVEYTKKLEWLIKFIYKLRQESWSGSLTLHFHKGNMSKKFNLYSIEYIEGGDCEIDSHRGS